MVINKIYIAGYGKLKNISFDFQNGLNMIYGLNESGKTTLQKCILALLFGQEHNENVEPDLTEKELMRPWDDGFYRASINYRLKDGKEYTVWRDFNNGRIKVLDSNETNISYKFPKDENSQPDFLKAHFGIDRSKFLDYSYFERDLVKDLNSPGAISAKIFSIIDGITENFAHQDALERLRKALFEIERKISGPDGKLKSAIPTSKLDSERAGLYSITKTLPESSLSNFQASQDGEEDELDPLEIEKHQELEKLEVQLEKVLKRLEKADRQRKIIMSEYQIITEKLDKKGSILETKKEILQQLQLAGEVKSIDEIMAVKKKLIEEAHVKEVSAREICEKEQKVFQAYRNHDEYEERVKDLEERVNKKEILALKETNYERTKSEIKDLKSKLRSRFLLSILIIICGGIVSAFGIFKNIFFGDMSLILHPVFLYCGGATALAGIIIWFTSVSVRKDLRNLEGGLYAKEEKLKKLRDEVAAAQIRLKEMFTQVGALSTDELRKRYRDYVRARVDLETATNLVKTLEKEIETLECGFLDSADMQETFIKLGYLEQGQPTTIEAVNKFKSDYKEASELSAKAEELKAVYEKSLSDKAEIDEEIEKLQESVDNLRHILEPASEDTHGMSKDQYDQIKEIFKNIGHGTRMLSSVQGSAAPELSLEPEKPEERIEVPKSFAEMPDIIPDNNEEQTLQDNSSKSDLRFSPDEIAPALDRKAIFEQIRMAPEELGVAPNDAKGERKEMITIKDLLSPASGDGIEKIEIIKDDEKKEAAPVVSSDQNVMEFYSKVFEGKIESPSSQNDMASVTMASGNEEDLFLSPDEMMTKKSRIKFGQFFEDKVSEKLESKNDEHELISGSSDVPVEPSELSVGEEADKEHESIDEAGTSKADIVECSTVSIEISHKDSDDHVDMDKEFAGELTTEEINLLEISVKSEEGASSGKVSAETLKKHKKAIEAAIESVEKAARDYKTTKLIPELSDLATGVLCKLTDKYSEIQFDEDFNIVLKPVEVDKLIRIEKLSKNAQEQAYFALRLGIAKMLCKEGKSLPLIMEEPFIEYDEQRRKMAMETLAALGDSIQVFLFTFSSQEKQEISKILKVNGKTPVVSRAGELEIITAEEQSKSAILKSPAGKLN